MHTAQKTDEELCGAVQVRNVPKGGSISEKDVASILNASGLSVRSVHFDNNMETQTKLTALVRLEPPELPWLSASKEVMR